MDWIKLVHGERPPQSAAAFATGDEIRVWYRILEQGKERFAQFEGIVIRTRGSGAARTFTVRRVTHGEGVERVFPFDAKIISRIEVLRQGKVHRSRLYYLRHIVGRARIAGAHPSSPEALRPAASAAGKAAEPEVAAAAPQATPGPGNPS
jgi:large subunit ribosomal protein L19